jgi:opacity protein-like surface antigen
MRFSFCACAVLVASAFSSVSPADAFANDLGEPIDLSSFSGMESALEESQQTLGADGMPIVQVYDDGGARWIRPYVTGIAGASFGTLNTGGVGGFGGTPLGFAGSVNEAMFTGGGAIGVAFDQPSGLLRMEVEGRARGPMQGKTQFFVVEETNVLPIDTVASGGWSAMTNFWRDWFLSDRFGVYGGGGFGVGGYQYSTSLTEGSQTLGGSSTVNTFAWQVGTGFTYQLSDRVTFDTGYRFFAMSPASNPVSLNSGSFSQSIGSSTSAFSASELLLSIRIYEPFRNWR